MMNTKCWEHYWFGFFNESNEVSESFLPNIQDFQSNEKESDIDKILTYLKSSPNILQSMSIPTDCMLCDEYSGDPGSIYYDGLWLWPERLVHYVECHNVVLPV